MKDNWRSLVTAGVIAYLVFLAFGIPAAQIESWTRSDTRPLQFDGLSGTLWAGHADTLRHPQITLNRVRWRLRPSALFLGRLEYRVRFTNAGERGEMRIGKDIFGRIHLGKGDLQLQAGRLDSLVTVLPLHFGGSMDIQISDGVISDSERWISGTLVWRKAGISAQSVSVPLGALQLSLERKDDGVSGNLVDLADSGPFDVDALLLVAADGSYSIKGTVLPRGALQPEARTVLDYLGTPDNQGRYQISFAGAG